MCPSLALPCRAVTASVPRTFTVIWKSALTTGAYLSMLSIFCLKSLGIWKEQKAILKSWRKEQQETRKIWVLWLWTSESCYFVVVAGVFVADAVANVDVVAAAVVVVFTALVVDAVVVATADDVLVVTAVVVVVACEHLLLLSGCCWYFYCHSYCCCGYSRENFIQSPYRTGVYIPIFCRGFMALAKGSHEDAYKHFVAATKLDPENSVVSWHLICQC